MTVARLTLPNSNMQCVNVRRVLMAIT